MNNIPLFKDVIEKVRKCMIKLRTLKNTGTLKQMINLKPIISNVTRWSSTYSMLKR